MENTQVWIEDLLEQEKVEETEGFQIDSAGKANWAVCKIKEARERRDLFNQAAQNKIEQMQRRIRENEERCRQETAFLLGALERYIDIVPAKKTKTQETLILPDGKLKKKFASQHLVANEEKLVEYLEEEKEYINIIKKAKWGEFKKLLKVVEGTIIRMDTGEVIDCVSIEEKAESFDVE